MKVDGWMELVSEEYQIYADMSQLSWLPLSASCFLLVPLHL